MNEQFFALPEEKRLRIINAGFEVFGTNEYKRASTDLIALKAGISKGLLFYYFHNKKSLYMFLFDYATELITADVVDEKFNQITDFFELCAYSAQKKYRLLSKMPHITDFLIRAFYSQKEDVSSEVGNQFSELTDTLYDTYFKTIDFSKFRDDIDPREILDMLTYVSDGHLHELQRNNQPFDLSDLMKHYCRWSALLKRIAYKEEYQI
jgi:TetR/AcrR family transcriptional regulator